MVILTFTPPVRHFLVLYFLVWDLNAHNTQTYSRPLAQTHNAAGSAKAISFYLTYLLALKTINHQISLIMVSFPPGARVIPVDHLNDLQAGPRNNLIWKEMFSQFLGQFHFEAESGHVS